MKCMKQRNRPVAFFILKLSSNFTFQPFYKSKVSGKKNTIIPLLAQEKFLPSRNPEERRSAKNDRKHVTSFISSVIKA